MAIQKAQIVAKSFTDTKTGEIIKYDAFEVQGVVYGELMTLSIKMTPTEKKLAKILLASQEDLPTTGTRSATGDEQKAFQSGITRNHTQISEKDGKITGEDAENSSFLNED